MCANFLGEVVPNRSKCEVEKIEVLNVNFLRFYHISAKTGCIPKPGAPDDLRGHQVQVVCVCRTYVQ